MLAAVKRTLTPAGGRQVVRNLGTMRSGQNLIVRIAATVIEGVLSPELCVQARLIGCSVKRPLVVNTPVCVPIVRSARS